MDRYAREGKVDEFDGFNTTPIPSGMTISARMYTYDSSTWDAQGWIVGSDVELPPDAGTVSFINREGKPYLTLTGEEYLTLAEVVERAYERGRADALGGE